MLLFEDLDPTDLHLITLKKQEEAGKGRGESGLIATCPANTVLQSGAQGHNKNEATFARILLATACPRSPALYGGELHLTSCLVIDFLNQGDIFLPVQLIDHLCSSCLSHRPAKIRMIEQVKHG